MSHSRTEYRKPRAVLTIPLAHFSNLSTMYTMGNEEKIIRILLVEDDRFIREIYHELLTESGFTVDIATDGDEGFQKITEGGYDLVLLDIMLPKRDGLDILKTIQEHPSKLPNKQIVLLTNLGQESIMREAFLHGASGYLIKSSLTPDQVLSEVQSYLNK